MDDHSLRKTTFLSLLFTCLLYRRILKCHIKNCFKINGKQTIKMPKKGEYVKFKNLERKIKSPFRQILKVFYCLEIMKGKIQMSVTLTNIKSMLLVVMAIN